MIKQNKTKSNGFSGMKRVEIPSIEYPIAPIMKANGNTTNGA